MPDNLGRCLENLNNRLASEVTGTLAQSMFHVYHFEKSKQQTSQGRSVGFFTLLNNPRCMLGLMSLVAGVLEVVALIQKWR